MPRTWLITGSSRDLARALAASVLAPENKLVFTPRNPRPIADLLERHDDAEPRVQELRPLVGAASATAGE
jgi:NAD(P)-dependent dehydrogenase (short-subunit alcohol dehydrogenase family)